ncbi:MAG: DUF3306 domain-containing protein [Woeseiaceae bacterium]|jgi:hypothetical protein
MSKPGGKDISDAGAPEVDTLEHEEFLTRWSKRKALAREGADLPEPDDDPVGDSIAGDADDAPRENAAGQDDTGQGAAAPATLDLPPIESLGEDSDYAAFLAAEVPADVQRKALRKLFQSPKFNVRDGLDDYDLDFSSPEPLGDIVTAEMRRRLRQELERLAGLDGDEGSPQDAAPTADAQVAGSEEQEQSADSEPDDDQPATA